MEKVLWAFLFIFGWFLSGYLAVIIAALFNRWGILNEDMAPDKANFSIIVSLGPAALFIIVFYFGGFLIKSLGMFIVFIYEKLRDFAVNLSDRKEKE